MTIANQSSTYTGDWHCGAVRFSVVIDNYQAIDCNCSICCQKGFLHLLLPPENIEKIRKLN